MVDGSGFRNAVKNEFGDLVKLKLFMIKKNHENTPTLAN